MADDKKAPGTGPFDMDVIQRLVRLMKQFDLSEVDLSEGAQRIKLRRGARLVAAAPIPVSPAAPTPAPSAAAPVAAPGKKFLEIKSSMVGTFYAKPAPDKDDYVKVGSKVAPDTVVCKVEAMKIFNDLTAGVSGTITEVLAANGGFVEYDQVLFRVDPG